MSFVDPNARLFTWNGDLYRGIHPSQVAFYEGLFQEGIVEQLVATGMLVQTERTRLSVEPFGLVLKHGRLPFVSYPFEWSPRMLRDAGLLVLDLQSELLGRGLTLQDAHSWNVLWDGAKPVFVDFSSIKPFAGDSWTSEEEFREFFVRPLKFMAAGQGRLARLLMQDVDVGIQPLEASLLSGPTSRPSRARTSIQRATRAAKDAVPGRLRPQFRKAKAAIQSWKASRRPSVEESLQTLRDEITALKFPTDGTDWSGYYDGEFPPLTPDDSWTPKHRAVHRLLAEMSPGTVMDAGANRGWFAQLAARHGAAVVACDTDEVAVDLLYQDVRANGLNVQPLVMNIIRPWPGAGVNGAYAPSAVERFRCDVVLALALTHHLVFSRYQGFDQIATVLSAFAKRALIVEFVPRDDQFVREWISDRHDWYTVDNFILALKRHLPRIQVHPSHPHPRVLIVAER